MGKLLLFFFVYVFERNDEFVAFTTGLYQLALVVLNGTVAEHPVIEVERDFVRKQISHAAYRSHLIEQTSVFRENVVFDVGRNVFFVVARDEFVAVTTAHGFSHAIANGLTSVHIYGIDVGIGQCQCLNQVVLRFHDFFFVGDIAECAQNRAVFAVFILVDGKERTSCPTAALRNVFLNDDGFVSQTLVYAFIIGETAHSLLISGSNKLVYKKFQCAIGLFGTAQQLAKFVGGNNFFDSIFFKSMR